MAIVSFPATYQSSWQEMARLLDESPLNGKQGNEVIWSLDAIQVWQEWFTRHYGELTAVNHHTNPDDPPDLDFVFEKGRVGVEHTVLQPHPLGFAEAIAKKTNPGGGRLLPSLSRKWSREELEKLAVPMTGSVSWAGIGDEHRVAFAELVSTLKRKMKDPASQVICITDKTSIADSYIEWLASDLNRIVSAEEISDFSNRTVILHQRDNNLRFFSALIRRGEPLLAKRDGRSIMPRNSLSFV